MRIRDLDWRGEAVWPPEWWPPERAVMIGKNCVLKAVSIQDIVHQYIHVEIETLNGPLWGVIVLEDPGHLEVLCHKLKENIGKSLTEIGNMEINLSLPPRKRGQKQARPHRKPSLQKLGSNTK
jgi:hypothetical protein